MALTEKMDIPTRQVQTEPWTRKTLIVLKSTVQTLAQSFSALEVILLFMILISGIGELIGRHFSYPWYALLFLILVSNILARYPTQITKNKKK
jgi:uncharacterized membrane protein YkvI